MIMKVPHKKASRNLEKNSPMPIDSSRYGIILLTRVAKACDGIAALTCLLKSDILRSLSTAVYNHKIIKNPTITLMV